MRKNEPHDFLSRAKIPFKDTDRVKTLKSKAREYVKNLPIEVEVIAETNNHKILWLPPYQSELNPLERIWGVTKNYVASQYSSKSCSTDDIYKLIDTGLSLCTEKTCSGAISKCFEELRKL